MSTFECTQQVINKINHGNMAWHKYFKKNAGPSLTVGPKLTYLPFGDEVGVSK